MYRVKLIKADGTVEYKRFRGINEADTAAKAAVLLGQAEKAFIYVDTPDGLKLKNKVWEVRGEDDGREDD